MSGVQALLPTRRGPGPARELAAVGVLAVGLPLLTVLLVPHRRALTLSTPVLLMLVLVVAVALVGGVRPAVPAALVGALTLNWFFIPPYGTLAVAEPEHTLVLVTYAAVALVVGIAAGRAEARQADAVRAQAEAQTLASLAGATLAEQQTLDALLEHVRRLLGMREVRLVEAGSTVATTGALPGVPGDQELRVPAGEDLVLAARGPALFGEDRRLLGRLARAAATALQGRRLAEQAQRAGELTAVDRTRTALLAAVGHDLRTPLATAKAAVSGLRQHDVALTGEERDELLAAAEESVDRLEQLVANLLDASRLQAGAVSVHLDAVAVDAVVASVLLGLDRAQRERVHLDLADDLPLVRADAGLLERVLANLVDNALRHTPRGTLVSVQAVARADVVATDVVDHGPGLPAGAADAVFLPFQRLDDRSPTGTGLGLWIARGFTEAMHGRLTPEPTRGGGLTMRVTLPRADR